MAKYEIVHEKKQENGLANEGKVSDFTIKRFLQFPCLNIFILLLQVSFSHISATN